MDNPSPAAPAALDGVKVVDFSRFMPAAYVTWLFGDMGADVVRIEHPRELAKQAQAQGAGGETPEANAFRRARQTHTRNKRSLLLNPGNAEARKAILELIRRADVLVEDYRPGVLAKMGYGYAEMAQINPRLIYVSVTAAGQTGPYADRAGHDPIALSLSGALSRLNGTPTPTMPGVQVADVLSGAHATVAALMALQARHVTGRGQQVDVAMSDACLPLIMLTLSRAPDLDQRPTGAWHPKGGVWECADGEFICTTDMETAFWRKFCETIGRPDYIEKQHDLASHPQMESELRALFLTRPRDAWMALLSEAGTQVMPVYSIAEALDDPHNRARGMVVESDVGGRKITQVAAPFILSETPARVRRLAGAAGADTDTILAELGYGPADLDALRDAGAFNG